VCLPDYIGWQKRGKKQIKKINTHGFLSMLAPELFEYPTNITVNNYHCWSGSAK